MDNDPITLFEETEPTKNTNTVDPSVLMRPAKSDLVLSDGYIEDVQVKTGSTGPVPISTSDSRNLNKDPLNLFQRGESR